MTIQPTSRAAYETADLSRRQLEIHDALAERGPLTDLEIAEHVGVPINGVCGARNALVKFGLVKDSGKRRMSRYGKENIVWELVRVDPATAARDPRDDSDFDQLALFG